MVRVQSFLGLVTFLSLFSSSSSSPSYSPSPSSHPSIFGAYKHLRDDSGGIMDSTSSSSITVAAAGSSNSVVQGDKQCPSELMCVAGIVNGSTVTYELQSTGSQSSGWMSIGFGTHMGGTPMVIMWLNADGTMTLSQRQSVKHEMPTAVASPAAVATAAVSLSSLSSSQPVLAFTIAGSAQQVPLIWAYGDTRPAAAANSTLQQHVAFGKLTLDLTKTTSLNNVTLPSATSSSSGSGDRPLLSYEKIIVAHAIIATFGFLFLLPSGVLLARYFRTISTKWYTGHWIIQATIAGPVVIAGCTLGFVADHQLGSVGSSPHKTMGAALLGIYLAQCLLGAFIHYVKIPFRFGRPPQNYAHAILGLATIALSINQVHTGYHDEWPLATGRGPLSNSINIFWMVWVILLTLLYSGGLAYLPRQWRQEKSSREQKVDYEVTFSDSQEFHKFRNQST